MAMKRSKFTEVQIAFILPQAGEGAVIAEVWRSAEIGEAFTIDPGSTPA